MTLFLTVLHVMVCIVLIAVVLLQRGKGAEIGAVFGGGASSTVFGSRGAGNFLTKLTTGSAVVFMVTSLALSYLGGTGGGGLFDGEPAPAVEESPFQESGEPAAPAAPGEAATDAPGGFAPVEGATPTAPAPTAEATAPEAQAAAPEASAPAAPEAPAAPAAPTEAAPGAPSTP